MTVWNGFQKDTKHGDKMRLHFHIWKYEKEMARCQNVSWAYFRTCIICGEKQCRWTWWYTQGWKKL